MALSGDFIKGPVLVELVVCRQVGNMLSGRLYGIALLEKEKGDFTKRIRHQGKFRLTGFIENRLLVLNYRSTVAGVQSVGAIAMKADDTGKHVAGTWAGCINGAINHSDYIWERLDRSAYRHDRENMLISRARDVIKKLGNTAQPNASVSHELVKKTPMKIPLTSESSPFNIPAIDPAIIRRYLDGSSSSGAKAFPTEH